MRCAKTEACHNQHDRAGLAAAAAGALRWSEVAVDAGYFDQSHMNRTSRHIIGFAPEELRRRVASDEDFWACRVWQ
jgi:methylphosphotriester-DNA--protein-cysteine methyltransferase